MSTETERQLKQDRPLKYATNVGFIQAVRFYAERVAFTRRGNFSFMVAMLYMIYDMASHIATIGVPATEVAQYLGTSLGPAATLLQIGSGVLTVVVGLTGAIAVLMLLDLYEHEVGLTIEKEL